MRWFGCILLQGGKSFNYLNFIYVTISCTSQNYYFQKSIVFQKLSSWENKTKNTPSREHLQHWKELLVLPTCQAGVCSPAVGALVQFSPKPPSILIKCSHPIKVMSVQPSSNDFYVSIFNTGLFFFTAFPPYMSLALCPVPKSQEDTPENCAAVGNLKLMVKIPGLPSRAYDQLPKWLAPLHPSINLTEGCFV